MLPDAGLAVRIFGASVRRIKAALMVEASQGNELSSMYETNSPSMDDKMIIKTNGTGPFP